MPAVDFHQQVDHVLQGAGLAGGEARLKKGDQEQQEAEQEADGRFRAVRHLRSGEGQFVHLGKVLLRFAFYVLIQEGQRPLELISRGERLIGGGIGPIIKSMFHVPIDTKLADLMYSFLRFTK